MEDERDAAEVDLAALAAKLDGLDLTDAEHEFLLAVFAAAGETLVGAEVSGFNIHPCIKVGIDPCLKLAQLGVGPCLKVGRGPLSQGFLNSFGFQG